MRWGQTKCHVNISGGVQQNNYDTFELIGSAGLGLPKASESLTGQFGNAGGGYSGGINNKGQPSGGVESGIGVALPFEIFNVTSIKIHEVY